MEVDIETMEWAMVSALFISFLEVNAETPGMDQNYYRNNIHLIYEKIPIRLQQMLIDWAETDEGIAWRAGMRLGPFSDFPASKPIQDEH